MQTRGAAWQQAHSARLSRHSSPASLRLVATSTTALPLIVAGGHGAARFAGEAPDRAAAGAWCPAFPGPSGRRGGPRAGVARGDPALPEAAASGSRPFRGVTRARHGQAVETNEIACLAPRRRLPAPL